MLSKIRNADFGQNTCFDYVSDLIEDGDRFGVVVFVEPAGNITKWGPSWEWVLNWWFEVFSHQPGEMHYADAGWHLEELAAKGKLPDDPGEVWMSALEGKGE